MGRAEPRETLSPGPAGGRAATCGAVRSAEPPGRAPLTLTPEQQEPLGEAAGAHVRTLCHPAKACRLTTGTRISMEITGSNSFPLTGAV